jgi:hypothetical protein
LKWRIIITVAHSGRNMHVVEERLRERPVRSGGRR